MWMPLGWVSASGAGGAKFDYELISTTVLGATTTSVTFTLTAAQQAAYKHLQLRVVARDTYAGGQAASVLQLNGDTANNYAYHRLIGNSSTVNSYSTTAVNSVLLNAWAASTSGTSIFGSSVIDILDSSSTAKYKTVRIMGGNIGLNSEIGLNSGLWMSTATTSSLTITAATQYVAGSRFSLYGVRG